MSLRDMVDDVQDFESEEMGVSALHALLARPQAPLFSTLEEQVMTLAERDTLASLEAPGLFERAARLLFGIRGASRALADARLEALRRAFVVARHRRHLPDPLARELRERGFAAPQLRAIEARAIA